MSRPQKSNNTNLPQVKIVEADLQTETTPVEQVDQQDIIEERQIINTKKEKPKRIVKLFEQYDMEKVGNRLVRSPKIVVDQNTGHRTVYINR